MLKIATDLIIFVNDNIVMEHSNQLFLRENICIRTYMQLRDAKTRRCAFTRVIIMTIALFRAGVLICRYNNSTCAHVRSDMCERGRRIEGEN